MVEIIEHFQWLTQEESRNLPPEKLVEVREEIGDLMILTEPRLVASADLRLLCEGKLA